jgi:hypothetical protein
MILIRFCNSLYPNPALPLPAGKGLTDCPLAGGRGQVWDTKKEIIQTVILENIFKTTPIKNILGAKAIIVSI